MIAELTIIVPTYNEKDNTGPLVEKLDLALGGIDWLVLFVDDNSPDDTYGAVQELAKHDDRVHGLLRVDRRGLSSACIEGILAAESPYVAVMDGDLQHDESILPQLLKAVKEDGRDIAIGSRYFAGGSTGDWSRGRIIESRIATLISRLIMPSGLSDPMSGFFVIRRQTFLEIAENLSGRGFKILLDIFSSSGRDLNFIEIPYSFRLRQSGQSKLDAGVVWAFLSLLLEKTPQLRFAIKGLIGALVLGGIFLII